MEVVERSGRPAVGIFGEGFRTMAEFLADQAGVPRRRLAVYPGVMATASHEELAASAVGSLLPQVLGGLLGDGAGAGGAGAGSAGEGPSGGAAAPPAPSPAWEIVARGDLDEVTDHFYANGWTDGLPIVPPTPERVEAFLARTARDPGEVLGVLPPEQREATVASVAVNGVMAGCRPEHMGVLVALTRCLADPAFHLEDAGSTPGWEALVLVSGPGAAALGFNAGTGVLRPGRRANSAVGRFARLYMRNVAGLRIPPGVTDQAGMGSNFFVAMAENDAEIRRLGWAPYHADRGFPPERTVVTVQGVLTVSAPIYTHGDRMADHLAVIAYHLERAWSMVVPTFKRGGAYQLVAMSPAIAAVFARNGVSKADIRRRLAARMRTRAGFYEQDFDWGTPFDLRAMVRDGRLPADLADSGDPERLIRVVLSEEWLGVVVTGNPGRNQTRGYATNHVQGLPVSREVEPSP